MARQYKTLYSAVNGALAPVPFAWGGVWRAHTPKQLEPVSSLLHPFGAVVRVLFL